MPSRYDFPVHVAVKIIVLRGSEVLLLREPEHNEWMPGRLGLPGGKLLLGETLSEAMKRKIKTEIGFEVRIEGLIKVMNILLPERTVYHFVFLARHEQGEINLNAVEAADMRWYSRAEVAALSKDDFTEYSSDELIIAALDDRLPVTPLSMLAEQDNRVGAVLDWMRKGQASG